MLDLIPPILLESLTPHRVYLVGGAVRDGLLNKTVSDFDFVVFGIEDLAGLCRRMADKISVNLVELDDRYQIYRLVGENWQADFSAPRGESIEMDLAYRDFTINSIAYDLKNDTLVDPHGGMTDLQAKSIRSLTASNLEDDPLRVLRAFRFQSQLSDFQIDPQTFQWIKRSQAQISRVAVERVSFEIWKLLAQEQSYSALWGMVESGLAESIMPEIAALRHVPANDFHHLPLLAHTFELIKQYEQVVSIRLAEAHSAFQEELVGQIPLIAILKMSCLLHDIAKPQTWTIKDGRHTFYGHDSEGAEICIQIGARLKWPRLATKLISDLVKLHLQPFCIAPNNTIPSDKAQRRLFRKLGAHFPLLIGLAWSDTLSTRGPVITDELIAQNEARLKKLLEEFHTFQHQETSTPPLLRGETLEKAIAIAKLPPTAAIKQRLTELRDLQLNGEITSSEQAYHWFVTQG